MKLRRLTVGNVKNCEIDYSKISNEDKEIIGRRFLACVEDYFKRPGVEEDFKIWQANRKKIYV